MTDIRIVKRDLTPQETDRLNAGFDALSLEEGVELEGSDRISFIASVGDRFIGCASGLAFKNGDSYSGWSLISDLYVEKENRSSGLGSELLIAFENELKKLGIKHVFLWTSGVKALRFYDRHEYQKFAEMENWYSDNSNRVGLRKDF